MRDDCDNSLHGDKCPLTCSNENDIVHTDSSIQRRSVTASLNCFCRRNHCQWRGAPASLVKSLFCTPPGHCPNPVEYFNTEKAENIELECKDPEGNVLNNLDDDIGKRQSWSPAEQDAEPVKITSDTSFLEQFWNLLNFGSAGVGKLKRKAIFEDGTRCSWKCKGSDQTGFRPKVLRQGVVCKCSGKTNCHWKVRTRQVSSMNPKCLA